MKLIKTLFLTTLAVGGLFAGSLRAQDSTNMPAATPSTNAPPRHLAPRGPSVEFFAHVLNLTDDQKAKVQPILNDQFQKRNQIVQDYRSGAITRDEASAKMKQLHDEAATQLKPILTDEQFQKWERLSQPRHHPMMTPPGVTNGAAASAP